MSRRVLFWGLVSGVGLLSAACGGSSESLDGTRWTVATIVNAELPDGVVAGLDFVDESAIAVTTGCNNLGGSYTTDGDAISIGPLAGTLRACEEPLMLFQTAYTAALERAATYTVDGDVLTLSGAGGAELVSLVAFDPQLAGTTWQVTSYNDGNQAVVSVIIGTELTLDFAADGTVAGSAGCNTYTGPYETDGDEITIGPLAATRRACPDPAGAMAQEAQYLVALQAATTWNVTGTTLELRDAGRSLQVSAQPSS